MTDKRDLPNFRSPPVVEVVLSLQFDPIDGLGTAQLGLLWGEFEKEFPVVQEHPPIESQIEHFGKPPADLGIQINFTNLPPMRRLWFVNEDGTHLIQVQQDRFIHNWRGKGDKYPRYESLRDKFQKEVTKFDNFLRSRGLNKIIPIQCEVTYINQIFSETNPDEYVKLDESVTVWKSNYSDNFLKEPEDVRFYTRHLIIGDDDKPIGRLHVSLEPSYLKKTGKPVLVLSLTARGKPINNSVEGAFEFFEIGREWIVKGFTSITTRNMHKQWRKYNGS